MLNCGAGHCKNTHWQHHLLALCQKFRAARGEWGRGQLLHPACSQKV